MGDPVGSSNTTNILAPIVQAVAVLVSLSLRIWMPAPPLGTRLFQLALEGVASV